jgi:hypothetical protein
MVTTSHPSWATEQEWQGLLDLWDKENPASHSTPTLASQATGAISRTPLCRLWHPGGTAVLKDDSKRLAGRQGRLLRPAAQIAWTFSTLRSDTGPVVGIGALEGLRAVLSHSQVRRPALLTTTISFGNRGDLAPDTLGL